MRSVEIRIRTGSRFVTDITELVADFCADFEDGLCNIYVPHATAGIAIFELGAGTEPDLQAALERILPTADIYRHRHGSLGHGRDHVIPAFISPSMTVPVLRGSPALGTWQSIAFVDTNSDNPERKLRLSFVASN